METDYIVVECGTSSGLKTSLSREVKKKEAEGWKIYGSPSIAYGGIVGMWVAMQAIVKPEKVGIQPC